MVKKKVTLEEVSMPKRFSFILAHPDDEIFVVRFIELAVKNGHDVEIASMTKGEYGTMNPSLKGKKLARIRVQELQDAAKAYGLHKNRVKFLGLLDGNVTLKRALKTLQEYLQKRKPDVIFAPEYDFSVYVHPDHLNTGKATCILLKKGKISPRPLLFTFHSFKNNIFIKSTFGTPMKTLKAHKSQFQVIGYLIPLLYLYNLLIGFLQYHRFMFVQACRRIFFEKKLHLTFLERIFHAAFSIGKLIFKPWRAEKIVD